MVNNLDVAFLSPERFAENKEQTTKQRTNQDMMRANQVADKQHNFTQDEKKAPCGGRHCVVEKTENEKVTWIECEYCFLWFHTCRVAGMEEKIR